MHRRQAGPIMLGKVAAIADELGWRPKKRDGVSGPNATSGGELMATARESQRRWPLVLLLSSMVSTIAAAGPDRFPRPEFEILYDKPFTTAPPASAPWLGYLDVALLVVAMALAAHLALRKRSRRGLFYLTVTCLLYFGLWRSGCVCPVGSLQNVTAALANRDFLLPLSVIALFVLPLAFALYFGRVFCAGVCPLGGIQDLVMMRPLQVPPWLAEVLGLLRYLYLGFAVLFAATGSLFLVCSYDPFVAFFRLDASSGMFIYSTGFLLLAIVVARPYCRFLCPYGVLLGWMSYFTKWRLTTSPDYCTQCRLCEQACPMGAIRKPSPQTVVEGRSQGIRRLAIQMALVPVVMMATGWIMAELDVVLARAHPNVRLAERVALEDSGQVTDTTLESRTFRSMGTPTAELEAEAISIRQRYHRGGWLLGAFWGLVVMVKLITLSVRRKRQDYEPDPAACFNCGRCFAYCPQEPGAATPAASQQSPAAPLNNLPPEQGDD